MVTPGARQFMLTSRARWFIVIPDNVWSSHGLDRQFIVTTPAQQFMVTPVARQCMVIPWARQFMVTPGASKFMVIPGFGSPRS